MGPAIWIVWWLAGYLFSQAHYPDDMALNIATMIGAALGAAATMYVVAKAAGA